MLVAKSPINVVNLFGKLSRSPFLSLKKVEYFAAVEKEIHC